MEKPDVESIEGLSPAISIEQKTTSRNPRSTVGTVTEIYDYLRLLFARVGRPHCPSCGKPITVADRAADRRRRARAARRARKIQVLAPIVRGPQGDLQEGAAARRRARGSCGRAWTATIRDLADEIDLDKQKKHTIEIVVDRLVVQAGPQAGA